MIRNREILGRLVLFVTMFFVLVITAGAIDSAFFGKQHPLRSACANKGLNGLWLRYYWYAGKHESAQDWADMLERLRFNQIKYAYFHVLTTKSDGTLKMHELENAKKITSAVHSNAPKTKAIAWVYVGAVPQKDGSDLSKAEIRKSLVNEARWLVEKCGFDGVQWDYEFCSNGDRGLLLLLDETRLALKPGKLISVATPMWYPNTLWGWNDEYFKTIASKSDQICVMCYDSYLYFPSAYAWLVSQQVLHVSSDVADANASLKSHCRVIFGLPTYDDATLAHRFQCESFANSLRGLNRGLTAPGAAREVIEGIAPFADYTTDGAEWKTYFDYWLHCSNTGADTETNSPAPGEKWPGTR